MRNEVRTEKVTEYTELIKKYEKMIEAEEWVKGCTGMHMHRLDSMWYETEETKKHLEKGMVTDYSYPDGHIERFQDGKLIHIFGEKLEGDALLEAYLDSKTD